MQQDAEFLWVDEGGITSPLGFRAGGTYVGIRTYGPEPRRDVGVVVSECPATVAGVFTQNRICGAPVTVCRERVAKGRAQVIVANSGCSNVANGQAGIEDARRMAAIAASKCGVDAELSLVASTGVIGRRLPMDKIEQGVAQAELSPEGGLEFARAIMTTDTTPKQCAVRVEHAGHVFTIGGVAKGAGMAHPNMATVLVFLATDAEVEQEFLQRVLKDVADESINMVDVDMDTSTSDTMLLLANGKAEVGPIAEGHELAPVFRRALRQVCVQLARELARDGEGARTLITVQVVGAADLEQARLGARTVVSSPLVKTMITGRDPNPGRVLMAIGRAGVDLEPERISVSIQGRALFEAGVALPLDTDALAKEMDVPEVQITVDLKVGAAEAVAWGCDLTEGYVRINADYTT